jgi:hypothetical protein
MSAILPAVPRRTVTITQVVPGLPLEIDGASAENPAALADLVGGSTGVFKTRIYAAPVVGGLTLPRTPLMDVELSAQVAANGALSVRCSAQAYNGDGSLRGAARVTVLPAGETLDQFLTSLGLLFSDFSSALPLPVATGLRTVGYTPTTPVQLSATSIPATLVWLQVPVQADGWNVQTIWIKAGTTAPAIPTPDEEGETQETAFLSAGWQKLTPNNFEGTGCVFLAADANTLWLAGLNAGDKVRWTAFNGQVPITVSDSDEAVLASTDPVALVSEPTPCKAVRLKAPSGGDGHNVASIFCGLVASPTALNSFELTPANYEGLVIGCADAADVMLAGGVDDKVEFEILS